jgi:hypothetical protein
MIESTTILPLLTGLVGWLLNELSHRRREVTSYRRAISCALSDLLEIRHQIFLPTFFLKAISDKIIKQFKLPQEVCTNLMLYIQDLIPSLDSFDSLEKRYNNAVDAVASVDPLLGFRLRWKGELPRFLKTIKGVALQDPGVVNVFPMFEERLLNVIKPHLDEIILELAKIHRWRTWWRVRKFLRAPVLDKKDIDLLDELFSKLQPIDAASQQINVSSRSGT